LQKMRINIATGWYIVNVFTGYKKKSCFFKEIFQIRHVFRLSKLVF